MNKWWDVKILLSSIQIFINADPKLPNSNPGFETNIKAIDKHEHKSNVPEI
jgi:hypothetical protein